MPKPVPLPPPGFDELSVEDKLDYLQSLWHRIAATPETIPVPDWHREIINDRLKDLEANPGATIGAQVEHLDIPQAAMSPENARLYNELTEREARIWRLVNILGIFIWDFDGRIFEANEAFLQLIGYNREDLFAGRIRWTDLTPPDGRDRDAQWMEEHKRTGTLRPYEKEYFRKDGSRVPVLLKVVTFEEGGSQGVAFVIDLTERKRAEEVLHKAQAELAHITRVTTLGEMTASIAHEISQPLAAVILNANASLHWLGAVSPNLDEARKAMNRIVCDSKHASEVIGRIRALVKKEDTERAPVDINEVIQEVLSLMHGEIQKSRVFVKLNLANGLPHVLGDRIQLQQVILNLVMNGIEAMNTIPDRRRELLIRSSHHESDKVLLAAQDSGVGIDAQNLEKIFDAFYTTKSQGMGMGLAICRSIVENHGGRLWVAPNDGPGATFQFTLLKSNEERLT